MLALRLENKLDHKSGWYSYLMAHMTDVETGGVDNMPADIISRGMECIQGYKSNIYDPDTPTMGQAMGGPHREEFKQAMAI